MNLLSKINLVISFIFIILTICSSVTHMLEDNNKDKRYSYFVYLLLSISVIVSLINLCSFVWHK